MRVSSWMVHETSRPMTLEERDVVPQAGEALVEVAGCGVCHTDLGFYYDGVQPPHREETIRRHAFVYRTPGEAYEYCNLAFGILDYIVTVKAGRPFGKFLEEAVFDPAGKRVATYTSIWRQEQPGVWRIIFDRGNKYCE